MAQDTRKRIANEFSGRNIDYVTLAYDVGLSHARNAGLSRIRTKYFVLADDDMLFTSRTKLESLYEVLERGRVSLVSCTLRDWGRWGEVRPPGVLRVVDRRCYVIVGEVERRVDGLEIYTFVPNFFMASVAALGPDPWDAAFKIGGEHEDFFLRLKERRVMCASLSEIEVAHYPFRPAGYRRLRDRGMDGLRLLNKKRGLMAIHYLNSPPMPDSRHRIDAFRRRISPLMIPVAKLAYALMS